MTRDIKFRAQSIGSFEVDDGHSVSEGDWVYGNLLVDGVQAYVINGVIESTDQYIAIEQWCPVDTETVGQYVGLKDENGIEIYEGDIVESEQVQGLGLFKGIVTFSSYSYIKNDGLPNNAPGWYLNTTAWDFGGLGSERCHWHDRPCVIGNIYENSDLLEVQS